LRRPNRFYSQGKEFLQLSKELGNKVELYAAQRQPHGFFNRSPWHQQTTFLVDKFLARHGYLAGGAALKSFDKLRMVSNVEPLGEKDITLKRIAAEQKEGERPKPRDTEPALKVGQLAPDFKLPPLVIQTGADGQSVGIIGSELVSLSFFRGKKPVCLIFSSYT
jgi:hypothetical protein